jgi:hypothetical protein
MRQSNASTPTARCRFRDNLETSAHQVILSGILGLLACTYPE